MEKKDSSTSEGSGQRLNQHARCRFPADLMCEYVFMRTTVCLPDHVFRDLKMLAARQGVTLKELLLRAVENELANAGAGERSRRLSFPLLDSRQPGELRLSNAEIDELLT